MADIIISKQLRFFKEARENYRTISGLMQEMRDELDAIGLDFPINIAHVQNLDDDIANQYIEYLRTLNHYLERINAIRSIYSTPANSEIIPRIGQF